MLYNAVMRVRKPTEKAAAIELRTKGHGYTFIARTVKVTVHTVISWVSHIPADRKLSHYLDNQQKIDAYMPTSNAALRKKLIRMRGRKCQQCGNTEWLGKPIPLELHHTDGDTENNVLENLELNCPNCHALTETWRRKKSSLPV